MPLASFLASPFAAVGVTQTGGKAQQTGTVGGGGGGGGGGGSSAGVGGSGGGTGGENGEIGYVFGTQTLNPGSQITVSGEVFSLAPDGSSVIVYDVPTGTGTGAGASGVSKNGGGSLGGGVTKTEGITALIAGGSASASKTQSVGTSKKTGSAASRSYTGHDRMAWLLGGLGGVWVLGLGLL
jgi:hypothetical protein